MRIVIQRVKQASVRVGGEEVSSIRHGLLLFVGVGPLDDDPIVRKCVEKIIALRIFEDRAGKMNLSIADVAGEMLVVSQFTLYADIRKGNRPSFTGAAPPDHAKCMYETFVSIAEELLPGRVQTGVFGADMAVSLCNDGPVTVHLDSELL